MGFYPVALAQPTAAVADISGYPLTITGVTAATLALPGPVVTPAAGQVYQFEAWGTITTTVDTQLISANLYLGGIGGTVAYNGSNNLNPNAGAPVTNASLRFTGALTFLSSTQVSASMQSDLNFTPISVNEGLVTVPSTPGQLVLGITPSATAVSVTINSGYWQRMA
jgi:hypothetical protein